MKTILALLVSLGLATVLAAQPAPPGPAKTPPGTKAAPGKEEKKEEPKIEGMEIARGNGGFLGVLIVNGGFKINFYDKEKKPVDPDVARAVLRWDPKYKVGQERVVLNPGEPNALSSPRSVRPPYLFKLFITLIKDAAYEGAEAPAGESYQIDFRQ